jgi:transcriptional regulator with XRE-family HTH domain
VELRIKELLDKRKKYQRDLAKELDVSDTIVSLWCSNKITPSTKHLNQIADYLKVKVKDLIK